MFGGMLAAQQPQCSYENGRIQFSHHDVVDDKDRLTVRITYTYDDSGIVLYRTLTSFDKQGHISRREQYTAADFLLVEEDFKYDRHENLVRRTVIFYDEETGEKSRTIETRQYSYASDGTILHTRYYINGTAYYEN